MRLRVLCVLGAVLACAGCGGDADDDGGSSGGTGSSGASGSSGKGGSSGASGSSGNGGSPATGGASGTGGSAGTATGPGTITDPWRDFCVATFTEDYPAEDSFGTPLFTVRAGEAYLLTAYPDVFSSDRAQVAYLTGAAPYEFDVNAPPGTGDFPFTTDCPFDASVSYYAVFADVSVYAEQTLVTKLCDLEAGTALPRDTATNSGFALRNSGADGSIYEIFLNVFSAQCGGASSGFISVTPIQLFGVNTTQVPIIQIIAAE